MKLLLLCMWMIVLVVVMLCRFERGEGIFAGNFWCCIVLPLSVAVIRDPRVCSIMMVLVYVRRVLVQR